MIRKGDLPGQWGSCRNTVSLWSDYRPPHSPLSSHYLHRTSQSVPPPLLSLLFVLFRAVRCVSLRQQRVMCLPSSDTRSLSRWSSMARLADYLAGGRTEPGAHRQQPFVGDTRIPAHSDGAATVRHILSISSPRTLASVIYTPGFQLDLQKKHQNASSKTKGV